MCGVKIESDVHVAQLVCGHRTHIGCAQQLLPRACPVCAPQIGTDAIPHPPLKQSASQATVWKMLRTTPTPSVEKLLEVGVDSRALLAANANANDFAGRGYDETAFRAVGFTWKSMVNDFGFNATIFGNYGQFSAHGLARVFGVQIADIIRDACCGGDPYLVHRLEFDAADWRELHDSHGTPGNAVISSFSRAIDFLESFQGVPGLALLKELRTGSAALDILKPTYTDIKRNGWLAEGGSRFVETFGVRAATYSTAADAVKLCLIYRNMFPLHTCVDMEERRAIFHTNLQVEPDVLAYWREEVRSEYFTLSVSSGPSEASVLLKAIFEDNIDIDYILSPSAPFLERVVPKKRVVPLVY